MKSSDCEMIVKWRMGAAYDAPILNWRDRRLNFDSDGALSFDNAGAIRIDQSGVFLSTAPGRQNYNPLRRTRLVEFAEDLFKSRKGRPEPLSAFAAMQDARLFPSVEYIGPPTDAVCAQISYARTVPSYWRSRTEVILWPLAFSYRYWKLPDDTPAPWDGRSSELFWRGQTTGMSYVFDEETRPILTGSRSHRNWLMTFLTTEAAEDEDMFEAWAPSYQRLQAVSLCRDIPGADVRFVPMYNDDRKPMEVAAKYLGDDILADRLDREAYRVTQQSYKYILTLPGNDVPSSLRPDLLSGSCMLMPRPFWECDWFYGLTPDVHYIPLRADLADLEERLQWCRDNDAHCKEVAAAARAFALERFEPSIEFAVQARIAERLAQQTIPLPAA